MSLLSDQLSRIRSSGEKALVLFVTAGDPEICHLPEILRTLEDNGADVIEVGLPFSDPIADGPVIQASSQRALDRGTGQAAIFDAIRDAGVHVPIVLMGYYNSVLRRGVEPFARSAAAAGISGAIVSDLTPEESDQWREAALANHIDTIFLAAPTSTPARLKIVAERSTGFVYAVSRTGVTGSAESSQGDVTELVQRLRSFTETPVCVGFGIRTPDHVRQVCSVADGAVVGSSLVELLAPGWTPAVRESVASAVRDWKSATR